MTLIRPTEPQHPGDLFFFLLTFWGGLESDDDNSGINLFCVYCNFCPFLSFIYYYCSLLSVS